MTRTYRRLIAVILVAVAMMFAPALRATAITGGEPDGNQHPNVGLILFYDSTGGRYRCSATLVSPTVLLTAAHCTSGTVGQTIVTFDPVIAEEPPSGIPEASDPAVGYTPEDIAGEEGWYIGTAYSHPDYSDFTDMSSWNDVGVIVLDEPVTGIEPAEIAPVGTLDEIPRSQLAHTLFTIVGYGTEVRKPESGPQKPTPMSYPLIRRNTTAPGQKLTPQILQLNGNPNDVRGGGGSCFGDSGGPTFYQGQVVTVTSYGYTQNCRYLDGMQRVDIQGVQDWLATFGVTAG